MSPIYQINKNDVVRLDTIQAISNQGGLLSSWQLALEHQKVEVSMSAKEATDLVRAWDKYMEWKAQPLNQRYPR